MELTAPTTREKVDFLASAEAYEPPPEAVEVVETHMSWVFLTDRHAYKLKKPIRYDVLDFSTLELRRMSCQRELSLNRRLAPLVYLDVVPVTLAPGGGLRLGGPGPPVEWLVRMVRLPEHRMLDRLVRAGDVHRKDVEPAAELLARFYMGAVPAPVDGPGYREHLAQGIRDDVRELSEASYDLPVQEIRLIADEQLVFVEEEGKTLERRVSLGHVVEGHGDLRPEHVCLTQPPAVIDCLEFSRDLRIQDPLDELSFLALECLRLGGPEVGAWFLDRYAVVTGDEAPPGLLRFYRRFRALRRAKVAVWHLRDAGIGGAEEWQGRARWYVARAADGSPQSWERE